MSVSSLATALHDGMCHSIEWCDRAAHAKAWLRVAAEVLSDESPASALHERVCPAELDRTFPNGCGSDRVRHIEFLGDWLNRQGC